MPTAAQLPESIRSLAYLNAITIHPDPDFQHDMGRLGTALQQVIPGLRVKVNVAFTAKAFTPKTARAFARQSAIRTAGIAVIPIAIVGLTFGLFGGGTNSEIVTFGNVFGFLAFLLIIISALVVSYRVAMNTGRTGAGILAGVLCGGCLAAMATILEFVFHTMLLTRNFGNPSNIQWEGTDTPWWGLLLEAAVIGVIGMLPGLASGAIGAAIGGNRRDNALGR
jgi:hypothetical protein